VATFEISVNGERRFVGGGFCLKGPTETAGLFIRNAAAICPECLRVCADIRRDASGPQD